MFGRLTGVVAERGTDGSCVLDVRGVGYEVFVPLRMLATLADPPREVTLHIHTHVREDAFVLYGFPTAEDRATFRVVLGVSGVGPRIALSILSALNTDELATAIARSDIASLKSISGVGKKLAERLLLELKDKLIMSPGAARTSGLRIVPPVATGPLATVTTALVSMGYKPAQAELAVSKLSDADDKPVEELLRDALAQLA